jgi:small GTP-binding protein
MINDLLKKIFGDIRAENPEMSQEDFDKIQRMVEEQVKKEPPPRVAFIGEAGVGKSTTLNVLFNAGQAVSHFEACTQEEAAFDVEVAKGTIRIYDMPGLGESLGKREQHLTTYRRVLEDADVALWILDAQYRAVESIQRYLAEELKAINPTIADKMVFALNKVDLVHPADWEPFANLPSAEQKGNIEARIIDIKKKLREALPTWNGNVIGYSALRYYNLNELFLAMLDAMPKGRRWVLTHREALADYLETLDEGLREKIKRSRPQQKTPEEQMTDLIGSMTEEQRAELLKSDESVRSFITRLLKGKITGKESE